MLRQLRKKAGKTCHIYHLYYYLTNMSLFIPMHLILPLSVDMSWEIISGLDSCFFFFQKHITKKIFSYWHFKIHLCTTKVFTELPAIKAPSLGKHPFALWVSGGQGLCSFPWQFVVMPTFPLGQRKFLKKNLFSVSRLTSCPPLNRA